MKRILYIIIILLLFIGSFSAGAVWIKWKELQVSNAASARLSFPESSITVPSGLLNKDCSYITNEYPITMKSYDTNDRLLGTQTLYMGYLIFCKN